MRAMAGTIVFIHGAWVTARCWEPFVSFFEARGYRCLAPSWPYKDAPPAVLRASPPAALAGLGVTRIVDHYADVIRQLPEPPILIGHSFGGLFVELLLDRGLGRAGVAISPAPARGIFALYPSAVRSNLPVLARWGGWRSIVPVGLSEFAYGFLNLLPPAEQRRVYEEQATPETGRIFYEAAFALLDPKRATGVDFRRDRPPLLLTAGSADHNVVPAMVRATHARYRSSPARTDFHEFTGRSHWAIAEPGWEEVAAHIDDWIRTCAG
jgi:pimeloyl-ACP methyl ester carboxylesterase